MIRKSAENAIFVFCDKFMLFSTEYIQAWYGYDNAQNHLLLTEYSKFYIFLSSI